MADQFESVFDDPIIDNTDRLERDGDIASWVDTISNTILLAAIVFYLLGRGGKNQMTESDWQTLTQEVNSQYTYLNGFVNDITGEGLSKQQINARTGMYYASLYQLYHLARGNAFGLVLPGYPAVGTICKFNCRCHWDIHEYDDRWECFWIRTAAESCQTCIDRSSLWNPYIAYK